MNGHGALVTLLPRENVAGEVLHLLADELLKLCSAELREVGLDAVVAHAVEHQSVEIMVVLCEFLHHFDDISLIFSVDGVHHTAIFVFLLSDGDKSALGVIDHACPLWVTRIDKSCIVIVVPGTEHIHRSKHLHTVFMSHLDEAGEIVKLICHVFHLGGDCTVVEHLAGDGAHIDYGVGEAEVGYLLHIVFNAVGVVEAAVVGFGVKPHEGCLFLFGYFHAEWSGRQSGIVEERAFVVIVVAVAHLYWVLQPVGPHTHFLVAIEYLCFSLVHIAEGINQLEA